MSTTDNNNMDVDMNTNIDASVEKNLRVHPLAIIGISDHYTRVSTGGSVLPRTAATVGLLFGQTESRSSSHSKAISTTIVIIDAEEVETSADPSTLTDVQMTHIKTKIELHQKVFPQHEVVGWYKITKGNVDSEGKQQGNGNNDVNCDDDVGVLPTPQDVRIHNGWMREFNPHPIFLLMDSSERKGYQRNEGNTEGEDARDQLERDEELPLALYEIMSNANANATGDGNGNIGDVFINLDFELETFGPERIAVEQVFRTKPKALNANENADADAAVGAASSSSDVTDKEEYSAVLDSKVQASSEDQISTTGAHACQPSEAELHLQSVIKSVDAMNARVAILLDFLYKTRDGTIAPNHELLRQVMSLIKQLPLVMGRNWTDCNLEGRSVVGADTGDAHVNVNVLDMTGGVDTGGEFQNQYGDMLVMSYLAVLAKTTKAVVGYSQKFRLMEDNEGGFDSGRRSYGHGRQGRGSRGDTRMDE